MRYPLESISIIFFTLQLQGGVPCTPDFPSPFTVITIVAENPTAESFEYSPLVVFWPVFKISWDAVRFGYSGTNYHTYVVSWQDQNSVQCCSYFS